MPTCSQLLDLLCLSLPLNIIEVQVSMNEIQQESIPDVICIYSLLSPSSPCLVSNLYFVHQ